MIRVPGDFAGNAAVAHAVCEMLDSGRFPRLIVIDGPVGSGRKTLASFIARGAVCTGSNPPCGECGGCKRFFTGHPDVTHIVPDASKKHTQIGVDEIRDVISGSVTAPNEAQKRVYIIEDGEKLTVPAQNALLKTVEDGPEYVLFIFVCVSRRCMLDTVLSRAVCYRLSAVAEDEAELFLKQRFPDASHERIKTALDESGRILGRAADILNGKDDSFFTAAHTALSGVAAGRESQLLSAFTAFQTDRAGLLSVLSVFGLMLRDAVMVKKGGRTLEYPALESEYKTVSARYTGEKLMKLTYSVTKAKTGVLKNVSASLIIPLLTSEFF